MAIPFLNHLDLRSVSELQNAILHKTTSGSASNVEGKIIYDTGTDTIKFYNGSAWISLGAEQNTTYDLSVEQTSGNNDNPTITLTGSDGTTDNLTITGGTNITVTRDSATGLTIDAGASTTVGLTNGSQRSGSIELIAGTNVSITEDSTTGHFTFASTDTNTDTKQTIAAATDDDDKFVTFVETATGTQTGMSGANFKFNPGLNGGTLYVPNIIVSGDQIISNQTVKVVEDNTLQFEGATGSNADTELNLTTAQLSGSDKTVTLKNETGTVALTSDIKNATITISAGSGLVTGGAFGTNQGTNETITIDHEDTSTQASVDNSGLNVIQDVTLDTFGHVTGLASVDLQSGIDGRITNREFSGTIGNASATVFNIDDSGASSPHINHGLGSTSDSFMVQLIEVNTGLTAQADVARKTGGRVQVTFATAPAANNIRVLITKIG